MSNLIYTSTAEMTPEQWLGFRKCGLGASEVGAVMGLSQYKSNVELFYDKIGQGLGFSVENIAMFMGTELEQFIANLCFLAYRLLISTYWRLLNPHKQSWRGFC